jgi:adenylosuccinate synthase
MPLNIIVGAQWGDEGKGRVVDLLARQADLVARFNGGDNAGHTVTVRDQTYKLHIIPSGIIHPHTIGVIGNGAVVNPETLLSEMEMLRNAGVPINPERLRISYAAHLITRPHIALDEAMEEARGGEKIGTTLRGIGPSYTDKVTRSGLRLENMLSPEAFAEAIHNHVEDSNKKLTNLYNAKPLDAQEIAAEAYENARKLAPYIGDVSTLLYTALKNGETVLAEGAQGTLLDLDHGTYPFVTSSNPTAPGALLGLGLGIGWVQRVVGVAKAFQTRVGSGSFPTEVTGNVASSLRGTGENPWDEFGTTTGRPRRVGWLDMVLLRYAVRLNGLTDLALTKLDVLTGVDPICICVAYRMKDITDETEPAKIYDLPLGPGNLFQYEPIYEELGGWDQDLRNAHRLEDLPKTARNYILRVEELSETPVRLVSVGPERDQIVEIS